MSENEDRGYYRMSSYAFHQDAGREPWVNLRWVCDVIEQFEAGGRSLAVCHGAVSLCDAGSSQP
jgi:hypothetical protein